MKANLRLLTCLLSLLAIGLAARAADQAPAAAEDDAAVSPTVLKFSDPAKPGKIRLHVMWGDVTVTGADTPEVTIASNIKNKNVPEKRADGLRRLDSEVTYSAEEKDNVITVELGGEGPFPTDGDATLTITAPRATSVVIENSLGGDVTVKNLAGDSEIRCLNGEVHLNQISGAALVETMNGEIHAAFAKVPEGKPLSFTSMNGEVSVLIPADTKANVRLRTQNGAVYTDFDEKALVTRTEAAHGRISTHIRINTGHPSGKSKSESMTDSDWHAEVRDAVREAARAGAEAAREAAEAARAAVDAAREGIAEAHANAIPAIPPIPPMPHVMPSVSGGKVVSGTLNGGGPEIQIATMNGSITLRKAQP
ncbi:MAG TPA: DUF4097 family beta strand repeat-containing protein [Opitutaceae bacterium]|nr:DUF4097 family beta strand repeat-containing protein [Opitutaceae bacterium]